MGIRSKKSFGGRLNSSVRRAPSSKRLTRDWQVLRKGSWFEISEKQAAAGAESDRRLGRIEK